MMASNDAAAAVNPCAGRVTYRIAETRGQREAAFRLVYEAYLRAGLGNPNRFGMRVTPYHLLPTTEVFVAERDGEVVSTVSLIIDGQLGLPMESSYPSQVAERRVFGFRVGELSCFADRRAGARQFMGHFCGLARLVAQYARRQGLSQLLLVAHPRHARFYQRYLGFQMIGGLTACPHVRNRPAVALCLDFAYVDQHRPECYDTIFGEAIPAAELQPRPMSAAERAYFRTFIDPCFRDLFAARRPAPDGVRPFTPVVATA